MPVNHVPAPPIAALIRGEQVIVAPKSHNRWIRRRAVLPVFNKSGNRAVTVVQIDWIAIRGLLRYRGYRNALNKKPKGESTNQFSLHQGPFFEDDDHTLVIQTFFVSFNKQAVMLIDNNQLPLIAEG